MAEQEEEPEGERVVLGQFGESGLATGDQLRTDSGQFGALPGGQLGKRAGPRSGRRPRGVCRAARSCRCGAAGADPQRFALGPRGGGGDRVRGPLGEGVGVDREVPGGVEPESGAPQPVAFGVRVRLGEPQGQGAEVRRPVGAPGPAFVEGAYHGDQLRDRAERPATQQPGLRLAAVPAEEPGGEPGPARRPLCVRLGLGAYVCRVGRGRPAGRGVLGFAPGGRPQQRFDPAAALQLQDELVLVREERLGLDVVQADGPAAGTP